MHFATSVFLSGLLASAQAQEQKPLLSSWYDKARSYVAAGIPSPADAGAAALARAAVTELTLSNWETELRAGSNEAPANWLIQVTGGNKTCAGRCHDVDVNFNKTVALLSVTSGSPHFGRINCETDPVLCSVLFTGPPVLWYIPVPGVEAADQSRAPTPIYVKGLNTTEPTSVQEMVDFHSKKTYLDHKPLDNAMHPFDGTLAQYKLNVPIGYGLYYLSLIPSWGMMLVVSFFTRNMMSRRIQNQSRPIPQGQAPAPGAAAKKCML